MCVCVCVQTVGLRLEVTCTNVDESESGDILAEFAADDGDDIARSGVEAVAVIDAQVSVRLRRLRCQQQQAPSRYLLTSLQFRYSAHSCLLQLLLEVWASKLNVSTPC